MLKQAVILAGGLGTRLKPFTDTKPKPMIEFEEKPFLEYLIYQVKGFGIREVVLLLGYLPDVIMDYFGDGSALGIDIQYDVTPVEYDTGARIKHSEALLAEEFLLMYCDNYCPVNIQKALLQFHSSDALIQITAYANGDQYTKNNVLIQNNKVVIYDKKRIVDTLSAVDIGYAIVNKIVVNSLPDENTNFEACLYPDLVKQGKLSAYLTQHRYYSVGSWERIELTKKFFRPQKTIFLDRDGTINNKAPKAEYIESAEQFKWLPMAREAIAKLKENDYFIILITNQPGIARGMVTEDHLLEIHEKMQKELLERNGKIDKIYYCPHGWDEGCGCRKPKPGMLYEAQKEFSLNLMNCIVVGDDERDIAAGNAADCRTYSVEEGRNLYNIVEGILQEDEEEKRGRNKSENT